MPEMGYDNTQKDLKSILSLFNSSMTFVIKPEKEINQVEIKLTKF